MKHKIIILPIVDRNIIVGDVGKCIMDYWDNLWTNKNEISIIENAGNQFDIYWKPQQVIIVSEDGVESGDVYLADDGTIKECVDESDVNYLSSKPELKIIAVYPYINSWLWLPVISKEFIQEWIDAKCPDEVEVEYFPYAYTSTEPPFPKLKITGNNEVVCSIIKSNTKPVVFRRAIMVDAETGERKFENAESKPTIEEAAEDLQISTIVYINKEIQRLMVEFAKSDAAEDYHKPIWYDKLYKKLCDIKYGRMTLDEYMLEIKNKLEKNK